MTVFKTFLKVLNKYKGTLILYTVILIFFAGFNIETNDTGTDFVSSKPDVLIVNQDEEVGITKSLVHYMEDHSNMVAIKDTEEARDDALFYRDVNYIIYIPAHYREDFLAGKNPVIVVKSTGDYQSSLAELLLTRYLKLAEFYQIIEVNEDALIEQIETTLSKEPVVEMTSHLDRNQLEKATRYFNFANYCILAGCIYVVCFILSSFKTKGVHKRTIISSTNYKTFNRKLLLSNALFAFVLWAFYIVLGIILVGDVLLSMHGIFYAINSFLFTLCALTIAFLIGNAIANKNAISGLVNVIALGSSFLCGAFVPMEWLPDKVLAIAHILPSYWYIKTNEYLKGLEVFDMDALKPIICNMGVIVVFIVIFIILTNFISHKKQIQK